MLSSLLFFLSGWGMLSAFADMLAFAFYFSHELFDLLSSSSVIGLASEPLGFPLDSSALFLLLGFSLGSAVLRSTF